jgi:uncharacterized membrane protein YgaE (UPF0421/DUF939 family)
VRLARLRLAGWQITQCAVGAALAWFLAREVLGHPQPFFAPVAAVVALGVSYGQRYRRVPEIVAGVAIGVGVGDLFVHLVGTGVWQIALVVGVAMSIAVLLDAGTLIVTQAGVQAVIVTTLLPSSGAGLGRWLDAVAGGAVALVVAAVAPGSPLRRPRELAAATLVELADLLHEAAASARAGDAERAAMTLQRARQTEAGLAALRQAATEGMDVVRVSPFRRRHRRRLRSLNARVVPLDRAVRNVRVLVRRIASATRMGEPLPEALVELVDLLGDATGILAEQLAADADPELAVHRLQRAAAASAEVPHSSLSGDVILGQVRSTVVDLLQVAGLDDATALATIPAARGYGPPRPPSD